MVLAGVILELAVLAQWRSVPGHSPRWSIWAGAALIVANTVVRVKLAVVRRSHPPTGAMCCRVVISPTGPPTAGPSMPPYTQTP